MRLALVAALALVLTATTAAAPLKMKTAHRDGVQATVTWRSAQFFRAMGVRIEISRDARAVLARKLGPAIPRAIKVRDLDGDGEPEVILDLYTGGAHCCSVSRIYRYVRSTYVPRKQMWGNPSYALRELNGDRRPEFVSADDAFAYTFTSYASSAFPIRILSYRSGRMIGVTRWFPGLVRKDAAGLWRGYLKQRGGNPADPRGLLAAWLADQYLLGREAAGWATMERLNANGEFRGIGDGDIWPKNGAYLSKLKRFLTDHGYARKS